MSTRESAKDIVSEILTAVHEALKDGGTFTEQVAVQVERQIRGDWGGERAYVSTASEDRGATQEKLSRRNAAILRDVRSGDSYRAIARRYAVSITRVAQIVREA